MPEKKGELFITDKRVLQLMNYVISTKMNGISTKRGFSHAIGLHETAFRFILNGERGFTVEQIYLAHKAFGVNINWIFGISEEMFGMSSSSKRTSIESLKDAVFKIEEEMKLKANTAKTLK